MTTDANLAAVAQAAAAQGDSWLDYEHPEYAANKAKWDYASDHYSGRVLDPDKVRKYLIKKDQGESDESYEDRVALCDLTNDLASVVDGLVGMLSSVEGDATRNWTDETGRGLGDPDDPTSPAHWLMRRVNADGQGWLNFWKVVGQDLSVCNSLWIVAGSSGKMPTLKILPAVAVPDWGHDANGRPSFVKVKEKALVRSTWSSRPAGEDRWLVFHTKGWQRYRKDEDGNAIALTGPGDFGTYAYVDRDRSTPILPIFRVVLPLKRMVGYILARKQNSIFNKQSERDNLLRVCGFPKLNISGEAEHYKKVVESLKKGANVLHAQPGTDGNKYDAPSSDPAVVQTAVIEAKRREFYQTAHKEYGDSASERTATEARQDVSSGTGAFLQLLKSCEDDAENEAFMRLEQVIHPADPAQWFIANVQRSDDFMPEDPDDVVDKQNKRVFGSDGLIPMGITARIAAAKQLVSYQALPVNDSEIEGAVRASSLIEQLERLQKVGLADIIPAAVKARMGIDALSAMGYLTTEKLTIDGVTDEKSLMDEMTKQVTALAEQEQAQKRLESQFFDSPPA